MRLYAILYQRLFKISEGMVRILLMLEIPVLFIQDFKVEDLFCGAPSGSEPSVFSAISSLA